MILNNNNIHNSIAFNPMSDDLTYRGYKALACCIWGDIVNGIEIKPQDTVGKEESIKKAYGLYCRGVREDEIKIKERKVTNRDPRSFKYKNVRLVDIKTGEVIKTFNNALEAGIFLGMKDNLVNTYIAKGYKRENKYIIKADLNPNYVKGAVNRTKVRAINVNTGFRKEYDSVDEASKACGLTSVTIYVNARDRKTSKTGWKFEYIED